MKQNLPNLAAHLRSLLILGASLQLLLLADPVLAQTYTPVDYDFQDEPFQCSTWAYSGTHDDSREYIWMAANGYGQWAVNTNTRWVLLSNGAFDQNTSVTPPIPHGIVAIGAFNNPPTNGLIKVAANYAGSVRYVWLDDDRTNFVIEGFNDQSFGATDQAAKQIDISINGLPKPAIKRSIIKAAIYSYPTITVSGIVPSSIDPNWINHFDIAMDRKFLYIVFTTYDASQDFVGGHPLKVNVRAVDLVTGVVHSASYSDIDGFRPTIACDPRNNPENPTFDVGFLGTEKDLISGWHGVDVQHLEVINGGIAVVKILPKQTLKPTLRLTAYDETKLSLTGYGSPVYQCRILVSSVGGDQLTPPAKSMYILHYNQGLDADAIGILIEWLRTNSTFDDLWITDNWFQEPSPTLATNDRVFAAIHLSNSAAVVMHNTIEDVDDTYANGIYVASSEMRLNSFICNNFIYAVGNASGTGTGLYTKGWNGIAKLNEISYCDIGHVSDDNDEGLVAFSNDHDNIGPGLKLVYGNNRLDLRGMHDSQNDYAFFDTIAHNKQSEGTGGQIEITRESSQQTPPILWLGSTATSGIDTWGRNNIVSDGSGGTLIHSSIASYSLEERINKNLWAYGSWGNLTVLTLNLSNWSQYMTNIVYPQNNPICDAAVNVPPFSVSCGSGFDLSMGGTQTPQALPVELSTEECRDLEDKAHNYTFSGRPSDYQKAYDTAKRYVELCANVQLGNGKGERGFGITGSANFYRSEDPNRFLEYRDWLKSVLYLNPDSSYYCRDVDEIIGTFEYNPPIGYDFKAMEAILRWVHDSGKCGIYFSDFEKRLTELRKWWYEAWIDTTLDTTSHPWDTTNFPTIDELDLSILRGQQGSVNPVASSTPFRLGLVVAARNPFTDEVALKVELIAPALLRLDIFDELGKQIFGEGLGYKPLGEYRFAVNSQSWSSGTYYARLTTNGGEVRTVKMIKE